MQPLLEHYGYLAVGGFVLLEDFGVPAAGVAVLGAIIGDNIGFPVGHLGGWRAVERICTWAGLDYLADENIVEIYAAFERYQVVRHRRHRPDRHNSDHTPSQAHAWAGASTFIAMAIPEIPKQYLLSPSAPEPRTLVDILTDT